MSMDEVGNGGKQPEDAQQVVGVPRVVVAVIVMNGSAILLGRDVGTKLWTLPKGGVAKFQRLQVVGQTVVFETTHIAVHVTGSLFVSEEIIPPDHHQITVITLGQPLGSGDALTPIANPDVFSEVRWVDFRELGNIQNEIDNVTADAVMKFGLYIQAKTRGAQG